MAGGKETPRQKMIGMMYLVLTALLALNVTKEVVTAFVTINDKLDASTAIIENKIEEDFTTFELKKVSLLAKKANMSEYNLWRGKADSLYVKTKEVVSYLLKECNAMIMEAEGQNWISKEDEMGHVTQLKSLKNIKVKDNYDIPTQMFIGADPINPIDRGLEISRKIHAYRNVVTRTMGTYSDKSGDWEFNPPSRINELSNAFKTANPKDTAKLAHFYKSLTLPQTIYDEGEEKEMPWITVAFNRVPIVAAAAMFTSLKLDIKNAESIASEFMLSKINETPYYINKIEPMVFANSKYINKGDSLDLSVLIAAYDSNEVNKIRWGMDADTIPERWQENTGGIKLEGTKIGAHKVKGAIGVRERGEVVWKPWEFNYTVGQPMGTISQPEMRILYRGYKNEIKVSASGYTADQISVATSNGARITKENGKWIVQVERGVRAVNLTVRAKENDGKFTSIVSNAYTVRSIPKAEVYLGGISNGQTPSRSAVIANQRVSVRLDESVLLRNVDFKIIRGTVIVDQINKKGKILTNGILDNDAKSILRQSQGKRVTITCEYRDPSGETKRAHPLIFTTR